MQKVMVGGLAVDDSTNAALLSEVQRRASNHLGGYCVLANLHMGYLAHRNADLATAVQAAALTFADGKPVAMFANWLGAGCVQQYRGADLFADIMRLSETNGLNIGFYGGRNDAARDALLGVIADRFPAATIRFFQVPPMLRQEDIHRDEQIRRRLKEADVHILFVGIGCPKQEIWMHRQFQLSGCVMLGVGAVFDFIAGAKAEAPRAVQAMGLEWLHRLLSEPARLWRRYLIESTWFLLHVLRYNVFSRPKR